MTKERKFQISQETAAILLEMATPWFKVSGETLIGPFGNRADARAFPKAGTAVKACDLILIVAEVKVEIAPVEIAEVVETEAASIEVRVEKPIIRISNVKRPCMVVWNLADMMPNAKRKDVIAAAIAMGVATYTARTQYQLWFSVQKEMKAREAATAKS